MIFTTAFAFIAAASSVLAAPASLEARASPITCERAHFARPGSSQHAKFNLGRGTQSFGNATASDPVSLTPEGYNFVYSNCTSDAFGGLGPSSTITCSKTGDCGKAVISYGQILDDAGNCLTIEDFKTEGSSLNLQPCFKNAHLSQTFRFFESIALGKDGNPDTYIDVTVEIIYQDTDRNPQFAVGSDGTSLIVSAAPYLFLIAAILTCARRSPLQNPLKVLLQ
jgi:hypothetical protein